jgi:hypothetical protein
MLKNGNLLTTDGLKGTAFESDSSGNIIWTYVNPVSSAGIKSQGEDAGTNTVFRYEFYPTDFSGFVGKDLTPGLELENNPYTKRLCDNNIGLNPLDAKKSKISPNPAGDFTLILAETVENGRIYNTAGRCVGAFTGNQIDLSKFKPGIFTVSFSADGKPYKEKLLKIE